MASSLGLPISATVVSNGPKAVIASNEGKPIVTKFPREKISDDLHAVARLVIEPEAHDRPPPAPAAQRGAGGRASGPEPPRPDPLGYSA